MKYNYIIFQSTTGFSMNTYVGTFEDALAYIQDYLLRFKMYLRAGWIACSSDLPISEEEQDALLANATI